MNPVRIAQCQPLIRLASTAAAIAIALTGACRLMAPPHAPDKSTASAPHQDAKGIRFRDVAVSAGLRYRWSIQGKRPINILQGIGNGCAFLDYDGDGNLDILLVGPQLALYKGDGQGHFTDVTHDTGIDGLHGNFLGCAVGDYDNDGFEDIYLTAYRGGALLHNEHGKRFTDVSKAAGIAAQPWGTSAAFVDVDNDGKLDLYIANYAEYGPNQPQLCPIGDVMTACAPTLYPPLKGVLYRNRGNGSFADASAPWNVRAVSGRVLGIAAADFDGSGRQSLAVANDALPGNLLKNEGHRFVDVGVSSGIAIDISGNAQNGMGIDWGDYDNDGRLDLAIATYRQQAKSIYHSDGHGLFTDQSIALGVASPTLPYVAFGLKWLDADNDGWLDLMLVNGHTNDNIASTDHDALYREPTQLLHNTNGTRFADISATALVDSAGRPILGRGLALGDYDNDGRMDALVVDSEGSPLLLHNETAEAGHWVEIHLTGTQSNRDGLGAIVTAETDWSKLKRHCATDGSYMSASDRRVHFGTGHTTILPALRIRWPSGTVDTYRHVTIDRQITLREGETLTHSQLR